MVNYMRAEVYRISHSPAFKRILLFILVMVLLFNISGKVVTSNIEMHFNYLDLFKNFKDMLKLGVFFVLMYMESLIADDLNKGTIKNTANLGIKRDGIILSKIIVGAIMGLITVLAIIGVYFISGFILADKLDLNLGYQVLELASLLGPAIILWIASMALAVFVSIMSKSSIVASFYYYAVIALIPSLIQLLGLILENQFLSRFKNYFGIYYALENLGNGGIIHGYLLGLGAIVLFSIFSVVGFRKREL